MEGIPACRSRSAGLTPAGPAGVEQSFVTATTANRPARPSLPRVVAGASVLLLLGQLQVASCGGTNPSAPTSTSLQSEPPPGSLTARVEVATLGSPADRVVLEVQSARLTVPLSFDPSTRSFFGATQLGSGLSSVKVTAYSQGARVGSINVPVPIVANANSNAFFRIVDSSGGWPLPSSPVAITSLVVAPTEVRADDVVALSVRAVESASLPVRFAWTDDCGGRFASPVAATTHWWQGSGGVCRIKATATSVRGSDSRSDVVVVHPLTGTVEVQAAYIPWPLLSAVQVMAGSGSCALLRIGADASCRVPILPGEPVTLEVATSTSPGTSLAWTSDCGGVFQWVAGAPQSGTVAYTWTAPPVTAPSVCTLTPSLQVGILSDVFPIAVLVIPENS